MFTPTEVSSRSGICPWSLRISVMTRCFCWSVTSGCQRKAKMWMYIDTLCLYESSLVRQRLYVQIKGGGQASPERSRRECPPYACPLYSYPADLGSAGARGAVPATWSLCLYHYVCARRLHSAA